MAGHAKEISEAEKKLSQVQAQLDEIEVLKIKEPKLRQQIASLVATIEDLKEEAANDKSEKAFFAKEEEEEEFTPVVRKQAPAKPRDAAGDKKAALRAVNKKLQQIEKLKLKDDLDADAKKKVASEPKLRKQIAAIEAGETWVDSDKEEEEEKEEEPTPAPAPAPAAKKAADEEQEDDNTSDGNVAKLPTDAAEVEKRLKNLKKKLQQIAKLKEKGGVLDAEAKQKIDSEHRINQEVRALEDGKDEVIFMDKSSDDLRVELEKKLRTANKKLEQIEKLKKEANLDADQQSKVDAEKEIKNERNALQKQVGDMNTKERERVAQKLGWESEVKQIKQEQKHNAKKKGNK